MSSSIDIESKLDKSNYNPNFGDIKQFKLIIETKKKTYRFFKNTNEKYCQLTNNLDKINYNEIINFELVINNKMINQELINIKHKFDLEILEMDDCYVYRDEDIYIEFMKENKYTTCCCYIKNLNSKLFNTPPNY